MDVKEGIGSLKDEDGRDTADVGKMACILNHYFGAIQVYVIRNDLFQGS